MMKKKGKDNVKLNGLKTPLEHSGQKQNGSFHVLKFSTKPLYSQKDMENIHDFIARCRLQENKCKFWDAMDSKEMSIEQVITGTEHPEQLLAEGEGSSEYV